MAKTISSKKKVKQADKAYKKFNKTMNQLEKKYLDLMDKAKELEAKKK
jgi:hypothetical protein